MDAGNGELKFACTFSRRERVFWGSLKERLFYELHAWVVMPNHVHLLILPKVAIPVSSGVG
jgi:REP element-mobilizing transposase RayT